MVEGTGLAAAAAGGGAPASPPAAGFAFSSAAEVALGLADGLPQPGEFWLLTGAHICGQPGREAGRGELCAAVFRGHLTDVTPGRDVERGVLVLFKPLSLQLGHRLLVVAARGSWDVDPLEIARPASVRKHRIFVSR